LVSKRDKTTGIHEEERGKKEKMKRGDNVGMRKTILERAGKRSILRLRTLSLGKQPQYRKEKEG